MVVEEAEEEEVEEVVTLLLSPVLSVSCVWPLASLGLG